MTRDLHLIKSNGYGGIVYDIEGVDGDCVSLFEESFAAAKAIGLEVIVTTSHSGPYDMNGVEATKLVKSWVKDHNIDYISPQLYSTGREANPEFAETNNCKSDGCVWTLYQDSAPKMVPSIVSAAHYAEIETWFWNTYSIQCEGYIEWAQFP